MHSMAAALATLDQLQKVNASNKLIEYGESILIEDSLKLLRKKVFT